jgi:glycogen debranching enzyme
VIENCTGCSPQTWAAGALILILQSSLGLSFNAEENAITFNKPVLPEFLSIIQVNNIVIKDDMIVDFIVRRYGDDVSIEVTKKSEGVNVIVLK